VNAPFAVPTRVVKQDELRQIAYSVVLEPRTRQNPDSQGDYYDAEDIELAAHGFMEAVAKGNGGSGLMHEGDQLIGIPVESFIAPVDFLWGAGETLEVVKAGSWVMGIHYPDPEVWDDIVKGKYAAVSVQGSGTRIFEEA
jgi:putative serine protease XkdF